MMVTIINTKHDVTTEEFGRCVGRTSYCHSISLAIN